MQPREKHSLIIATPDWERALRGIQRGEGQCAVGALVRSQIGDSMQWCAHRWQLYSAWPKGRDFPLVHDWFVYLPSGTEQSMPQSSWRKEFNPLLGQNLIVAQLGIGEAMTGWQALLIRGDKEHHLEQVKFNGVPPLNLTSWLTETSESIVNSSRWSRLANALGSDVLERIENQHIMLIGASRNGSLMARHLAAMGVTRLSLVDHDVLELHNLDAMLGCDASQVGRMKVEVLANELVRFREDMTISCLPWRATDRRVIQQARLADTIITCVDHGTPVLLAAKVANQWNKLHIDVGTNVQKILDGQLHLMGDVRLFAPHEACASCVGGIASRDEAELDLNLPAGSRALRPTSNPLDQRAGSLVTINSITVSLAVQAFVDCLSLTLPGSTWIRIDRNDSHAWQVRSESIIGPSNCSVHSI